MKLTDGLWQSRPGWKLHHPCGIQEYRLEQDAISVLALCKPMRSPTDLTDATTLVYRFSAPRPDMIRVSVTHYAGALKRARRSNSTPWRAALPSAIRRTG